MQIYRQVFDEALPYLSDDKILLFIGARQVGKTTILRALNRYLAENKQPAFFLNLEDPEYLELLNQHPKNIFSLFSIDLSARTTLFIDEIQYLDDPSRFLKYLYDEYKGKLKIIVSGSSAFYIDQKFTDSLAGRKKIFHVQTLSFYEFVRFRTDAAFAQKKFAELTLSEKTLSDNLLREYMIYGGYPAVVLAPTEQKSELLRELVYSYAKKDVLETGIRDSKTFFKLFKILAKQVGNLVNATELANTLDVSKTAITNYLHVMQKSFHIALITPFAGNIRKEITKMPKVYFYDIGLYNFLVSDFDSFIARKDRGQLLENMAFRMLLNKNHESDIHFWRTTTGNEVDFVVGNKAYEIKTSSGKMDKGKYSTFCANYPNIDFSFVSLDCPTEKQAANQTKAPCLDIREL